VARFAQLSPGFHLPAALGAHTHRTVLGATEGPNMRSPRWLTTLAIPALLGAALVTGTPTAAADPTADAYLDQLRGAGLTWPPGHEEALIGTALLICDDLGWGWTPQQIANQVHGNLDPDNISVHDVGAMVNIARQTYCPNQRCWAAHC